MSNIEIQGTINELGYLPGTFGIEGTDYSAGTFGVHLAGRSENLNSYQVQVYEEYNPVHAWSSEWPEWAYLLAKEALMNHRILLIIHKDEPFGRNIIQVYIMNRVG
jgi:hypothetical protein